MITGTILARNEAANIVDCIRALRPHVEEIILIDMESTDDTVNLARGHVTTVLSHPLISNFDTARNIAIPKARYEWLWFVDADERIPQQTGELVRRMIAEQGSEFEAINIPFKSYFCGKWIQHSSWWPGYTSPRVLKRGHFTFSERLHGGVQVSGREVRLAPDPAIGVDHFSYQSIEHYLEKLNRYTTTEAEQFRREGKKWDWQIAIRYMMRDLWVYYEDNRGVLDGEHGWVLAWLSGQYRWLSLAKLWDKQQGENGDRVNAPPSLDHVLAVMEEQLAELRAAHPVPPLGLVWRSPIWDLSGYADEGRAFVKSLAANDRPLVLEEIRWNNLTCDLPLGDRALFRALTGRRRERFSVTITDCIPTMIRPDPCASINVLRTTFETDRIPGEWLGVIEQFDECWVMSRFNEVAFRRSGVAPERLRVIPSCIDTDVFCREGRARERPAELKDRFVFLSVFEWQRRKGWDVLLRAYVEEFSPDNNTALLLKATRVHGQSEALLPREADALLSQLGTSLDARSDIVLVDDTLSMTEMAELYRSVDAFVLPSRGEGWGRPLMEAMACGLPTIGTGMSGNMDFMSRSNSFLVSAVLEPVSEEAAQEVPPYRGHRWCEPDQVELRQTMRTVLENKALRRRKARRGERDVLSKSGLESGRRAVESALTEIESRLTPAEPSEPNASAIRVQIEGELFANHSFSNINEVLARKFLGNGEFALSIDRKQFNPTFDSQSLDAPRLLPYVGRRFDGAPDVVIRHAFPPNWEPVKPTKWVHIQPWEFGVLPADWIAPLVNDVDEIWAPSNYVRDVYVRSGVPDEKIVVVPWGVHPEIYHAQVPPRFLPTEKTFKFLFVGGAIERKGFDSLLDAFLAEFGPVDDVALVVKDMGARSYYPGDHLRTRLFQARDDPSMPEIVYIDADWTPGQLASLYAGCDCLVAPYRGEGFGLPILEAMACGTTPIVPDQGASADFATERTAFLVASREVETTHTWQLCGMPLALEILTEDLQRAMRRAFDDKAATCRKGLNAARHVAKNFTWDQTVELMSRRIRAIYDPASRTSAQAIPAASHAKADRAVAACLRVQDVERELAPCLAHVASFVDEIVVFDTGSTDRTAEVAREYGARVVADDGDAQAQDVVRSDWMFWLEPADRLAEGDLSEISPLLERQSPSVSEIAVQLRHSERVGGDGASSSRLRLLRTRNDDSPRNA